MRSVLRWLLLSLAFGSTGCKDDSNDGARDVGPLALKDSSSVAIDSGTNAGAEGGLDASEPKPGLRDAAAKDAGVPDASACTEALSCSEAMLLRPTSTTDLSRERFEMLGNTDCGTRRFKGSECASAGRELFYQLDLSKQESDTLVHMRVEAEFNASLSILSSTCDDLIEVACSADHAPGHEEPFLAAELPPAVYTIVVDGDAKSDSGEFLLWAETITAPGNCLSRPENNTCAGAIELDVSQSSQLVFGSTLCATDDEVATTGYCQEVAYFPTDVFYAVDLRDRAGPTLLHASTDIPPTNFDTVVHIMDQAGGDCFKSFACNDYLDTEQSDDGGDLWVEVPPGYYYIAVEGDGSEKGDFGLILSEGECVDTNDSCETARELDPTLGTRSYPVNMACIGEAFYRLDLRSYSERIQLVAETEQGGLVLLSANGENCGRELFVNGFDLKIDVFLEPALYFLRVAPERFTRGPEMLNLTLASIEESAAVGCVDLALATCAEDLASGCCAGETGSCLLAYERCGLQTTARNCVCETQPECCTPPLTYGAECADTFRECGVFCPSFSGTTECEDL